MPGTLPIHQLLRGRVFLGQFYQRQTWSQMAPVTDAERTALRAFFKGKRAEKVLIETHPRAQRHTALGPHLRHCGARKGCVVWDRFDWCVVAARLPPGACSPLWGLRHADSDQLTSRIG